MPGMLSVHWTPHHRGQLGRRTDAGIFAAWLPPTIKIVWDGDKVPYLEDIPPGSKILWRNYPLSEQFHGGLRVDTAARNLIDSAVKSTDGLPQNGSGRDWQPQVRATAGDLPTPEQAAEAYVANAEAVAAYCAGQGVDQTRLLFEGPNEYPVWAHGYTGLARLERRRLQLMHQRLPRAGSVVSNLGVGWPGNLGPDLPPVWDWFAGVADAFGARDYLGAHEYCGFNGIRENWGWWMGRILKCPHKVPVLITECGIDGGVYGAEHAKQGYRNLPGLTTEDAKVARDLDETWEYARAYAADPRVREHFRYTYDGNRDDWGNFDIRTEVYVAAFLARLARDGMPQAGSAPTPIPTRPLPEAEPMLPVGTLADKCRWWLEESIRQDEAGDTAYAQAIRYSLVKLDGRGLFYRLENALKAGRATG